jgi:alpha-1,3-rhamnosyl/mannosyltransferase
MPLPASVPRRYFLHVGDLHVRRNLDMVARALAHARRRAPDLGDIGLVLAGAARDEAAALDLDEGTRRLLTFTGHAGEQLLLALYRSAAALVYPSRYEGFGLPLLEAMACGVPVIASRTSSIPEVVADAAVLLDPDDLEGWSAALERVAADQDHAAALRQAGRRRAAAFSWRRTAAETAGVYARLLRRA